MAMLGGFGPMRPVGGPQPNRFQDPLRPRAVGTPEPRVLGSFHDGGKVHKTGIYKLEKGEHVTSKEDVMNHDILSGKKPSGGKTKLHLVGKSKGHKPDGAHGRAAVKALGRTKTTGNFAKIEKAKGKGAAVAAYQNALKAHKEGK